MGLVFSLLEVRVEPASEVAPCGDAEIADDLEIVLAHEVADFLLTLGEEGEGGRLDAADGGLVEASELAVEGGHGPRRVDPDEPVGFGPAIGGVGERTHLGIAAKRGEGFADRAIGHRLHPEATYRLLHAAILDNVTEDEFPLAPGVTGVDELGHVLALHQLFQDGESRFAAFLLARFEGELLREDGEAFEIPRQILPFGGGGEGLLDEMADRRGDDVAVVFVILVMLFEATDGRVFSEDAGEVVGDTGLLGDDERLRHGVGAKRLRGHGVPRFRGKVNPLSRSISPATAGRDASFRAGGGPH